MMRSGRARPKFPQADRADALDQVVEPLITDITCLRRFPAGGNYWLEVPALVPCPRIQHVQQADDVHPACDLLSDLPAKRGPAPTSEDPRIRRVRADRAKRSPGRPCPGPPD